MDDVDERLPGAQLEAVRWDDPEHTQRWLKALEEQANDLHAVGWDRIRPKRRRVLSRHEAGRKLRAAWRAMTQLLEAAKAGLPLPPPPEPVPSEPAGSTEGERPAV